MRTPRCATCLIRSVGSGGSVRPARVVDVERVRPGLHEPRGRHATRRDIGGPNHGIFWPAGSATSASRSPARLAAQRAEHLVARQRGDLEGAGVDVAERVGDRREHDVVPRLLGLRPSRASERRATATSSVHSRCATWVATVQPGAGVARGPAVGAEPLDGGAELVALGARGRRGALVSRSVMVAPARRRGCAPTGRGCGCGGAGRR